MNVNIVIIVGRERGRIFNYYFLFSLGVLLVIVSAIFSIRMYRKRELKFSSIIKMLSGFLMGLLIVWMTAPSLKYVITKDFDVVNGKCTIEIFSSGRSSDSIFNMLQTDEQFSFDEIPELDAYGKSIPYYCEVTVTKDHMWTMDYKIYDLKTRKLIDSHR